MKTENQQFKKLKTTHVCESKLLSSDPSNYLFISKPGLSENRKTIRHYKRIRWGSEEVDLKLLSSLQSTLNPKGLQWKHSIDTQLMDCSISEHSQVTTPASSTVHSAAESIHSQSSTYTVNQLNISAQKRELDQPQLSPSTQANIPINNKVDNESLVDLEAYNQLKTTIFHMVKNSDGESILYEDKCKLMAQAATYGDLQTIKFMIEQCNTHPGIKNNITITEAAKAGQFEVVDYLMKFPKVNPVDQKHYAMKMSVQHGHLQVLKRLLEYPKVDPSFDNNYAIRTASINGFTEIVQHLLQDRRVDPTVKDFYAIRHAAKNGHMDIVNLLLADPRVNKFKVMIAANKNKKAFSNLIWILQNFFSQ